MSIVRQINRITVGSRHRRDMGDLEGLAKSIADVGLLHPIVITRYDELIAGERRLRACRDILGWTEIPVHVVNLADLVRGEAAENGERKDFLPSEIEAIRRALAPVVATPEGRPANETKETFLSNARGQTRDKVGAFAGVSGRTVEKIAAVMEAAEAQPERFAKLVEDMDRTGKVDGAFKQLRIERQRDAYTARAEVGGETPDLTTLAAQGKRFGVIYADPPWSFEVYSGKGKQRSAERHYDTASIADICALPVEALAADDCALFLWAVMPELPGAFEVIKAWGFEYKTVGFTWVKQNRGGGGIFTGMGYWTRANAEVCLLATRGSPMRLAMDVPQVLLSPVREHSQKPDEIRSRIERLLAGPYLELFARSPAAGWTTWGNEVPADGAEAA